MPSNINPYNVDGTFPVAGQDNSSQGFRDNFTNIKNNFTFAQNEISDLQAKALVTTALNGQTISNDMAGTQIRRPQLTAWTQSLLDLGAISELATLDFNQANFQKITTAAPINLEFANWPTSTGTGNLGYGLMRVWIVVSSVAHTVTLPSSVTVGVDDIAGVVIQEDGSAKITFDEAGSYVFDFSSTDSGSSYLVFDVTRNRATFRDPSFYFNSAVNSTLLLNYTEESFQQALELEQGQDILSVRGSINSVAIGNLATASYVTQSYDDGKNATQGAAGVSVTSSRGNIWLNTLDGVQNGDFIGYYNAYSRTGDDGTNYEGNNSGNAFMTSAGLYFFNTGSDVEAGLGGNIAIFTAPDGSGALNNARLVQAVGIEHDQSTTFYGDVNIAGNVIISGNATISGNTQSTVANVANIGDVTLTSIADGEVLTYHSATHKWINSNVSAITTLANLGDVTVTAIADKDFLRYDTATSQWVNLPYTGNLVSYAVTIGDDGSSTQNVFKLNGTAIKTSTGTTTPIDFKIGNFYKFDLSDASNTDAALGFSTTPDTADPASITAYTSGVTRVGTAGTAGAYVTIRITDATASPLYLYAIEGGVVDGDLYGGAVPNYVKSSTNGESTVVGNITVGSLSHASNVEVYGAVNTIGYVTAGSGLQNTAIGTVAPSQAYFTNAYTGGLQAQAIGNVTPGTAAFTTATTAGLQATAIGNVTPGTGVFTTIAATSTALLLGNVITGNTFVPSTSTAGGTAGQISFDSGFVYICIGNGNWKRAALTTF